MSKLDELIAELCPNGVEYKTINECVVKISNIKWADLKNEKFRYIDLTSVDRETHVIGETIYITKDNAPSRAQQIVKTNDVLLGATRPLLKRFCIIAEDFDGEICSTGFCVLRAKERIVLAKFLYHIISSSEFFSYVEKHQKGASYPAITDQDVKSYSFPVPPLEVQREIVRVLDNFTFLTAELTAELTARRKQYEFYRDKMIFSENVPLVELRSVVKNYCAGATPKKGNKIFYENGTIPWIRTQDVHFNEIYKVESYITEAAVEQTAAKWIPENCVIVAISGASAGRCAINKIKATTNQHCLNMVIDDTKALYEYVYYCIAGRYEELLSRKQGARGDLNSSLILGITIPLPPLEVQSKIVSMLNKFNRLLSDISIGLPAEIAARQKQYEYYRDKLLTFKELNA